MPSASDDFLAGFTFKSFKITSSLIFDDPPLTCKPINFCRFGRTLEQQVTTGRQSATPGQLQDRTITNTYPVLSDNISFTCPIVVCGLTPSSVIRSFPNFAINEIFVSVSVSPFIFMYVYVCPNQPHTSTSHPCLISDFKSLDLEPLCTALV